ncbi:hypothetical protein HHK36_014984 [Tetracentron sinense]|uniref:Serine aminopeptidase S33 domain-containing protein n=1 Tax=Tetracentron sinense TaxID=13715 RepID=A0A834Z171_TETSI|nr:hypothetical protein HHK36_014984 [Tetracentron sinense]
MNSIASQNMDFTPARRRIWSPFVDVQQQLDHCLFKMAPPGMRTEESMGGAVSLKVHLKQPHEWDGVILVAPMCKIAEDMSPPESVLKFITLLFKVGLKAKLFPQKDLAELTFRELSKRKLAVYNVISYSDQMRLRTAIELLKATSNIEMQVEKISFHSQRSRVSSQLLVLHGAADKVTDPLVSKFLYEKASSKFKTLKIYEEGCHCIL